MANHTEGLPQSSKKLGASTIVTLLLLGLAIPSVALVTSAGAAVALNSVDVKITTTSDLPFQYTLIAYNTSGYQVASFYGNYPEAAFGLPSGTYLITAAAYYQNYVCDRCLLDAKGANGTVTSIRYVPPTSEYGYAVVKVDSPTQVTITTKNSTEATLVNVPVHVRFMNGTAAVGAYVNGYVVGSYYGYSPDWVTYGQTDKDGNVNLVLPDAPVQVSASMYIPIQLPQNISTITVDVAGQKVNVTVYWQPNYVNLFGQALILPPQKGAEITLQVQQSYPYPIYYKGPDYGQGGVTTVTTTMSSGTMAGRQAASPPQANAIAPFNPTAEQLSAPGQQTAGAALDFVGGTVFVVVVGLAALVGVGVALVLSRRKRGVESARL